MHEEHWKKKLSEEEYKVLREAGTEKPFSGEYVDHNEKGEYRCKGCGSVLFTSESKYESKKPGLMGWPSFSEVVNNKAVATRKDKSLGMNRTEVICAKCGSHLGHVFDDEESNTGKHYCINSVALDFKKDNK